MFRIEEILKRKRARKERLQLALDSIVEQLEAFGTLRIILFGSLQSDEVDVHSDLDLLVIMPASRSGKEWAKFIYETIDRGAASDIIAYNVEEFERDYSSSSFLREIVANGKIVYEKRI
jgi:predicted nucleotidyltransferase